MTTYTADTAVVARWIRRHAHPLTTFDPGAPLTDLRPLRHMLRDATVVGLGDSTRGAHELTSIKLRLARLLVETLGFRTPALEENPTKGIQLDEHTRTGVGDPRALLADAWRPWRSEEMLDLLRWMRSHNERHPEDPVRLAGIDSDAGQALADAERGMAENIIQWHGQTAAKIVYWGGMAHTADGNTRTVSSWASPPETQRNAGSYLRERFGPGYVSIGLTFDHGAVFYPVPPPSPAFVDAALGSTDLEAYALDLCAPQTEPVRAWLNSPVTTRLIGPRYDPEHDAAHHMTGGSLAEWFDIIIHTQEATPIRLLT